MRLAPARHNSQASFRERRSDERSAGRAYSPYLHNPYGGRWLVSQTEVHITAVHHRSVDTGSASASVQADVHIVTEGDCFDPRTCCDEREQALIAALRAYLRPDVAPECL